MKILVTGSNGFIGKHLSHKIEKEYEVVGQGRGTASEIQSGGDFFEIDINSRSNWGPCLDGVNVVVHLAAVAHNKSDDVDYLTEVNDKATRNLACQAACNGVKRFIFISSIGVLGSKTVEPFSELSVMSPHSSYAESKLEAERGLLEVAEETNMEVVIIRPVLVYGAGATGNFAKLVRLIQKTPVLPFALCANKRSFISIDNLVDFIEICIQHPKAKNEVFCISDGRDVSIKVFTDGIAQGLSKKIVQLPVPIVVFRLIGSLFGKSEQIDQLVGNLQVDTSKARTLLGWVPPFSMEETFNKLVRHKA